MFAAQTVDLFNPELGAKTVDLIPGEDDTNTVDLLTPSEEDSTKTVDLLNPEQPSATIEQQKPIIEKNENKTVDTITPRGDDIVPAEGKKSTTTIVVGGDEIEEGETNENSEISPEEIILPEENEKEEKKDASFEDEEHHENAGVLPWSTDLVKPWSIYRAPKTVYRPGEDLDLTELLVEIKTGRSGSLYNIEDLINDEFTTITRTRKSDGQKVRLDDKIYEDETMTIHMDGCQDLTIDFTVDENLKDEAKAFEAFQQNLIREEFRNGLDFSLYLIKKGEKENPVVAYSLDPHKLTPIGNGVDKKLKDGPLFDLKDINTWDRYDIETIGKVKAILERSAEIKDTENIRKKLITQLAIWNVTSNIIPEEIDATVSEPTEIAPELKPAEETKENPEEDKKDEPIEIINPTTPEEETKSIVKDDEKVEDKKDETVEIKTEEKDEEKIEAEESEKIEEKAPVQSTVRKIVFNAKEIDVPYDDIELSDEEYELYKELTSLEAVELKNEDEDLKIYEPIIIEETENQYAELVTIGESDIDSIERVATEVTFDAVEYSFQNLYHTLETSSMLGFGQPRDFNVLLKATMKASRKIVEGDKFEVEILSKTLPILNGEEGRANDIQIDGKVVATAEYIAEEHKIVYTFVEDLDTDKVEIEQEFKQIKEEKATLLNMLEVSENLVLDAVRGAEGDEDSEENPEELEISPEDDNAALKLVLGNTPVQYSGYSFETKKFRLKTTMTAKAFPIWQIPVGWTFDVNIGPYLKPDPNYPLKNLYDPDDPEKIIAEPKYNPDTNTITYTYVKSLSSTKTLDIDQYLAFNTDNIGDRDKIDINISVEPKKNPKQQMPTKTVYRDDRSSVITSAFEVEFDENGEPNLNNQYKFFEYGENYRVTFDAKSTPIIEDRKMTAIDWEITFDANGRKLSAEDLKLITNFTAVENSGIKNIDNVKLNGQPVTNLESNFSNEFLINDSKNVVGKYSSDKYIFTFRTPVERQQQAYILDIAAKLGKVNRTGAVRLIQPYIDGVDLAYESPTVLKYSNRVTNKGEFRSEDQIRWTLTEEVSSGDDGILPLVTRALSDNQTIASFKVAYYILNGDGKMAKVGETKNITSKEIEQGKLDGEKKFAPGTIAVYEIITNIDSKDDNQGNVYSFGDNRISLYRNVDVNIKWSVQEAGKDNLPEETLTMKSEDGKLTTSKTIKPEENEKINPAGKNVQIENVKRWEFVNGELKEIKYNLTQKLPHDEEVNDGTIYYKELTNSFNIYDKRYEILNTIFKGKDVKTANIKIIKKDSKNNKLLLPGARFSLIGDGSNNMEYSGVTDYNGEVIFKNVTPGVYILQEDSAPDGYKRHNTTDTVTVDDNGRVTWTNNIIATENYKHFVNENNGEVSTDVIYRNASPNQWPTFMNALSYATLKDNKVNYYIYLKPDENTPGSNGTDKNTRLLITAENIVNNKINDVKVDLYKMDAQNKSTVKTDFLKQDVDKYFNNKNHVNFSNNENDKKAIRLYKKSDDLVLGKNGFKIVFPEAVFKEDKGYVLKVVADIPKGGEDKEIQFCYDWIVDQTPLENLDPSKILDAISVIPGKKDRDENPKNDANQPVLVINNSAKKRFPIIVNTKDDKREIVGGAEFTLTEKNTNRTVDIKTTDSNGRCEFRDIPEGEYLLKETQSPTGLSKYNLIFHVTVTPGGQILYTAYDENGNEVDPGEKYTIGTVEGDDDNPSVGTKSIKVLSHSMTLNETSGWGTRRGVWEEAKYEAYDFKASFMLNNTNPGDKIKIDFDDNWNMTQWSGEMPNIVTKDGQTVATPQLDTEKNILTYTLTDYVKGKTNINASLLIQSIRPSKYYVKVDKKDDGSPIIYKFLDTITTLPGAAEKSEVQQVTYVESDLGPYFGTKGDREPLYITQNVDITTNKSGNLELRNVTVFNPEGKENVAGDRQLKIFYGMTTDPNVTEMGHKIKPPYVPTRVVVYKVANPDKYNLPVTGGIKPSEDKGPKGTYEQIADFNIEFNKVKMETKNGVTLNYNENRVNISKNIVPTLNNNTNVQFMITLPPTPNGEGYVVEQFYEVTDEDIFRDNYSMTSVYYTGAWGRSGGISQMKPKKNSGTANSGKVVDVPEINHDLTVYHYKSIGNFIVKKTDEKGKALRGAKFTLTDGKGIVVDEVTVGEDGIGKFNNIPSGKYVLKETKAPDGYKATDRPIDVNVGDGGKISFDGIEKDDKVFNVGKTVVERKVKTKYESSDVWQELTIHKPWVKFMNIKSRILSSDNNKVKTRIYLNSLIDTEKGNGPDKVTVFKIEEALNTNEAIKTNVYKVPKDAKGNIDGYLDGYFKNNKISSLIPPEDEAKIVSNAEIEFSSLGDPKRWNGAAYVIDVEASYKVPNPDLGKSITQDRYIKYNWHCKPEPFTFIEGKVGTQLKVSKNEVDSSTPNGDGVETITESDTPTLQVINKKSKAKVTIVKVDEENHGQKLSGAVFKLLDENGKEIKREDQPYTVTTGEDGKATFEDLEPGTYTIIEESAPKGYELTNKTWTVVVKEDNTVEVTENSTVSKTVFGIDNPNTKAIGTWNFTYYQKHVLDVSPVIEKSGDGYVVNVNTKGTSYPNDNRYSQLNMYFDTEHFEFEDKNVNDKAWSGKYVYFNSAPNTYSFKFKPKANVEKGSYKPITGITYVNFPMSHEFLPTFNVKMEDGQKESKPVGFNSDGNGFSFNVSNKYKGYEVEFKKIAEENGNEIKLTGAKFILQIKNGENYVDFNPVYTAISDAKGKIKFSGIKPGEYKVVETDPPAGYYVLNKDVKFFKIDDDGKVFIMENGEYKPYTKDNAKILNSKPGDGKFKILKTDENNKGLQGVKFNLYNSRGDLVGEFTTDEKGEINFTNLPYDKYYVKEISTKPGYIVDGEVRVVLIGKKWEKGTPTGRDVSNELTLNSIESKMTSIINDDYYITPNNSEVIQANLKYKVADGANIQPGDIFKVVASENVDLDGIGRSHDDEYDIYGPAGLLATAEINKNRREITYTFTEYAKHYDIKNINIGMLMAVNRVEVPGHKDGKDTIAVSVTAGTSKLSKNFNVQYNYGDDVQVNACLVKYDEDTDEFIANFYLNHKNINTYGKKIQFTSNSEVEFTDVQVEYLNNRNSYLPWSFGIKDSEPNLSKMKENNYAVEATEDGIILSLNGNYFDNLTYRVIVKGKATKPNESRFALYGEYINYNERNQRYYQMVGLYKSLKKTSSDGDGDIVLTFTNNKNKIEYTKVDGSIAGTADDKKPKGASQGSNEHIETPKPVFSSAGNPLSGVKFQLQKKNANGEFENYGKQKESDTNGKFSWEGLPEGEYQVVETEAKPGYQTPKEAVSTFTVNKNGEIVDIKDNTTIIINEKIKPDIEFLKVDGNDKAVKLSGAEFTLYKAEKVENANNELKFGMVNKNFEFVQEEKEAYKVISGDNGKLDEGKFKFEGLEDGIYAVKETKAPKDYALLTKYAFFFKVEGGKIYRVDELGKYIDSNKKDVEDKDKDTDSLIVDITLDKPINNVTKIENFKAEYPATGGVGALPFVFIGMMIMMVGAYMFIRRRDALYE